MRSEDHEDISLRKREKRQNKKRQDSLGRERLSKSFEPSCTSPERPCWFFNARTTSTILGGRKGRDDGRVLARRAFYNTRPLRAESLLTYVCVRACFENDRAQRNLALSSL